MESHYYQNCAAETAVYPRATKAEALSYTALGLAGEAGEVANKVKKVLRDYNGEVTPEIRLQLLGELGDILWYVSMMSTELDCLLGDVMQHNLTKLYKRKILGKLHGDGGSK